MNKEVLFAQTLEQVRKTAKEQGNCISEEQVKDAFAELDLSGEQLQMVFDYLLKHKIGIGQPMDPDEFLTDEEKDYLQEYLDEVAELPTYTDGEKLAFAMSAMAGEADAQQRLIEHAFRRAGQHENGLCRQPADNHQSHAERRAECDNSVQRAVDLLAVVLPDEQREHGIRPDRQSDDQVDKNTDERHTAADRRQRFHTDEPAHDDGIGQIVELLKQAAKHQRDRKGEDQPERAALCHIFCHVSALLWGSSKATKPIFCRQKRPAGKGAGRCGFHECDYIRLR